MNTNKETIRALASALAEDSAKAMREYDREKAKRYCVSRAMNESVIRDTLCDPVLAERIIRKRARVLSRQLRQAIGIKFNELQKMRTERLSRESARQIEREVEQFESEVARTKVGQTHMVKVVNCQLLERIGPNPEEVVAEYVKSADLPVKEFERLVNSGALVGFNGEGWVYGYLSVADLELDDLYSNGGRIEVVAGNGITAVITLEHYLEAVTGRSGNAEVVKLIANNEIRYGRAQEFLDIERDQEAEVSCIEPELSESSYDYRDQAERQYWKDRIRRELELGKSHRDLYLAAAGILFPISKDGKQQWTRPLNIISSADRKQLLNLYHSRVAAVSEQKQELLNQVIEWSGKNSILERMIRTLKPEQAKDVLQAASRRRAETGSVPLSKRTWWLLNQVINGNDPTPSNVRQLSFEFGTEEQKKAA